MTGSAREAFDRSRARARAAAAVAVSGREELRGGTGEQEALPLMEERPAAGRPRSHLDRATAGVVAAVVVVLLVVVAALAWRQLPSLSSLTDALPGAGASAAPRAAPPAVEPPAGAEPAEPPAAGAPAPTVVGVRALDPDGDGQENDDRLPALLDDDPGTSWVSETYASSSFGNLKPGVGVVLDLEPGAALSAVDLAAAGSGGTVEVRTSPDGSLDGSAVVATSPLGDEGGQTTITLDAPVETAHVVLWVTRLPSTGEGFRADLSGVALS